MPAPKRSQGEVRSQARRQAFGCGIAPLDCIPSAIVVIQPLPEREKFNFTRPRGYNRR